MRRESVRATRPAPLAYLLRLRSFGNVREKPVCQSLLYRSPCGQPLGQRLLGNSIWLAEGRAAAWHRVPPPQGAEDATLDWLIWYNGSRIHSTSDISAQLSSSNKQSLLHSPSQPDRERSTATRRKSETITLMSDAF